MNFSNSRESWPTEPESMATSQSSDGFDRRSVVDPTFQSQVDCDPLQSSYGNAAVGRNLEQPASSSVATGGGEPQIRLAHENLLFLQRKIGNSGTTALVLAKLRVSRPDDESEREADRVADQITRPPDALSSTDGPTEISGVTPTAAAQVNGIQGGQGAEGLANSARGYFEPRLGQNLGFVRVHRDADAAKSAEGLNARAFTLGQDIFFGAGEYAPETATGKKLLAHELTHVMQQSPRQEGVGISEAVQPGGPTLQRTLSPHYSSMVDNLTYGALDWAITDSEAEEVLDWLSPLSADDLAETVLKLESDGYLNRLLNNISSDDRTTYAAVIQKIHRAREVARTSARIESFLTYGVLDWAITDAEAHEVLVNLQDMPAERRRVLVFKLVEDGRFDRLISNVSSADNVSFATLITELNRIRDEHSDRMLGTGPADPSASRDVAAELTPGVVRNPITGVPDPFVDTVAGHTYRQDLEKKLDDVRGWMFPQNRDLLAGTRLPMTRFEGVGEESKRQTDTVFGRYASGPALTAGTRASGANLIDRSLQTPDPVDLVRYLIHNQDEVLPVHTLHSAVPSRAAEKGIIDAIIVDYSSANRAELEVMDRGWPALAGGGVVEIQPFEGSTPAATRQMLWKSFQTLIHEYLHTITHPNYSAVASGLGDQEASVLTEGGTSLFTDDVWNTIFPDEIRANDALRANVEGSALPFDASVIPAIRHYDQIVQARNIRSRVGAENMRAAYFLGHTELIGLGPTWTPTAAATRQVFVVPATGISTVADVARATGVDAATIAASNGVAATDAVTAGQQLTVPGIRIHIVIGATETKATIAEHNGVDEGDLDRANPSANWAGLTAGQQIVIPVH